jgi:hypothetical protein
MDAFKSWYLIVHCASDAVTTAAFCCHQNFSLIAHQELALFYFQFFGYGVWMVEIRASVLLRKCLHYLAFFSAANNDPEQMHACPLIGRLDVAVWVAVRSPSIPVRSHSNPRGAGATRIWQWRWRQIPKLYPIESFGNMFEPTSAIFLFKEIQQRWTVGRAPSSPLFDFYSTIDLRCGLIYWLWTRHVIIHSVYEKTRGVVLIRLVFWIRSGGHCMFCVTLQFGGCYLTRGPIYIPNKRWIGSWHPGLSTCTRRNKGSHQHI